MGGSFRVQEKGSHIVPKLVDAGDHFLRLCHVTRIQAVGEHKVFHGLLNGFFVQESVL